jgi:hypothetical protein
MGETPKPPALPVLGEAWARAVRAVLDGMKHLVDAERIEAEQAVGGPVDARGPQPAARGGSPREPTAGARVSPGRVVASATTWRPSAMREAIDAALAMMREAPKPPVSPVRLTPIAVAPPTDSPTDTRSEHVVLLGAVVELPWLVP